MVKSRLNLEYFQAYKPIMELISAFLLSNLSLHKLSKFDRLGKQNAFRSRITSMKGAEVIFNYFSKQFFF